MATKIYGETGVSQVQDGIISDDKIAVNSTVLSNLNCMRLDNYFHCRDERSDSTGGGTVPAGWITRTLNTVKYNGISGASLNGSQITLPAGTYYVNVRMPVIKCERVNAAFYNVSKSSYVLYGITRYSQSGGYYADALLDCRGIITITETNLFEARMYSQYSQTGDVLAGGVQTSATFIPSVYTEVEIWKLG